MQPHRLPHPADTRVFAAQIALLLAFCVFAGLVVVWIGRLIYISWVLGDVFSASIGIALVAVPVFLFLLVMVNYVFWGLLRHQSEQPAPGDQEA